MTLTLLMCPATADRVLRPFRQKNHSRGISTTRPGKLLKRQVPVRAFADWTESEPGFMEADLVAHRGETSASRPGLLTSSRDLVFSQQDQKHYYEQVRNEPQGYDAKGSEVGLVV